VVDRQGQPIAGAEVLQSGDGPERTDTRTGADGAFRLPGYRAPRGLIFAHASGFRFGGRVVAPGENRIVLTRVTETPERALPMLPPPRPANELRALARRVLDPYLERALHERSLGGTVRALRILALLDPVSALEQFSAAKINVDTTLRAAIAAELARIDPDEAAAVAEASAEPADRARGVVAIVDVLPREQKTRRLALLDKAVVHARAATNPSDRLGILGEVGERLVEQGEEEKARRTFDEGKGLFRTLEDTRSRQYFAARLAAVDTDAALVLINEIHSPQDRSWALADAAIRLAGRRPDDCERLLRLPGPESRSVPVDIVCHRMAPVDPARAGRLVDELSDTFGRGHSRLILAHGLAEVSKLEAAKAFRAAFDELAESARDRDNAFFTQILSLPLVADIEPGLVPEFLWHALSLRLPLRGGGEMRALVSSEAAVVAIVARYDRELAAFLWSPVAAHLRSLARDDPVWYTNRWLIAQAQLDPGTAVEWVESLPRPARVDQHGQNEPRLVLPQFLALWAQGQPGPLLPYTIGPVERLARRDLP
jgi:hypothetical protein